MGLLETSLSSSAFTVAATAHAHCHHTFHAMRGGLPNV
jgi:hypothetical protein